MGPLLTLLFPRITRHRAALTALVAIALAIGLFHAPFSPAATGRADAALGDGDAVLAVARYDAVERWAIRDSTSQEALYRAAMVSIVDLGDARGARTRLERLARRDLLPERRAEVQELLGGLRLVDNRPGAAARAFLYAYEALPSAPEAARRLRKAARAREVARDGAGADALWQRLAEGHPDHRADAILARGALALADDQAASALDLFEEAAKVAPSRAHLAAARLGMATCLDRLGDLEGALAEIDASDLPADVRERRTGALRARIAVGGQL